MTKNNCDKHKSKKKQIKGKKLKSIIKVVVVTYSISGVGIHS